MERRWFGHYIASLMVEESHSKEEEECGETEQSLSRKTSVCIEHTVRHLPLVMVHIILWCTKRTIGGVCCALHTEEPVEGICSWSRQFSPWPHGPGDGRGFQELSERGGGEREQREPQEDGRDKGQLQTHPQMFPPSIFLITVLLPSSLNKLHSNAILKKG